MLLRATTLSHDDWQALQMAAHHWASTWQPRRDDKGEGALRLGEAKIDEGLMDWLGVNRTLVCPEGRFSRIFASQLGGKTTLRWREVYVYRSRFKNNGTLQLKRTGAKYAISVGKPAHLRVERAGRLQHASWGEISSSNPIPPWENNPCSRVGC